MHKLLKPAVTALALSIASFAAAEEVRVPQLLKDLREATGQEAQKIAREVEIIWSQSGSASANLLLRRGEEALEAQDFEAAMDHFTALTDHAPEFAEGWHGRARAFWGKERYGAALADLERTLALNPNHFGAIYGLGAIFEQLDHPKDAHAAYAYLLTLYPAHKEAQEALTRLEPAVQGTSL